MSETSYYDVLQVHVTGSTYFTSSVAARIQRSNQRLQLASFCNAIFTLETDASKPLTSFSFRRAQPHKSFYKSSPNAILLVDPATEPEYEPEFVAGLLVPVKLCKELVVNSTLSTFTTCGKDV